MIFYAIMRLQRFSPYYDELDNFNIKLAGPIGWYEHIYPLPLRDLESIAEEFQFEGESDSLHYLIELRETVGKWTLDSGKNYRQLYYERGPDFLQIIDDRTETGPKRYIFNATQGDIYLHCDAGSAVSRIFEQITIEHQNVTQDQIQDFLEGMVLEGLIYKEKNRYISLAVAKKLSHFSS